MAYNVVPNGSYLYAADWDSIHNHTHTGTSKDGALIGDLVPTAGSICFFNTTYGHDHDGTDSKYLSHSTSFSTGLIHSKTYTGAGPYTHNNSIWTALTSFTFGALNAYIIGFHINLFVSWSGGGGTDRNAQLMLKLSGSNLGNKYLVLTRVADPSYLTTGQSVQHRWDTSESSTFSSYTSENSARATNCSQLLKLLDATTTCTLLASCGGANPPTVSVTNVVIIPIYSIVITED